MGDAEGGKGGRHVDNRGFKEEQKATLREPLTVAHFPIILKISLNCLIYLY